jgi:hypothetical protein
MRRIFIITLAARLPPNLSHRYMVAPGGLMSYAPDLVDQFYVEAFISKSRAGTI